MMEGERGVVFYSLTRHFLTSFLICIFNKMFPFFDLVDCCPPLGSLRYSDLAFACPSFDYPLPLGHPFDPVYVVGVATL